MTRSTVQIRFRASVFSLLLPLGEFCFPLLSPFSCLGFCGGWLVLGGFAHIRCVWIAGLVCGCRGVGFWLGRGYGLPVYGVVITNGHSLEGGW